MNIVAQAAQSVVDALVALSQNVVVQQFHQLSDQLSWLVFPVAGVVIAALILAERQSAVVDASN